MLVKLKACFFSKKYINDLQPLQFNNDNISRVSSARYLGLQLTYNLDWRDQVDIVFKSKQEAISVTTCKKSTEKYFRLAL